MAQDQYTFNPQAYLAANPDVAASGLDPWHHYQTWGQNEGRQALFNLDQINSAPANFKLAYDPEFGTEMPVNYSYDPGHVGRMGYVGGDESTPGTYTWIPSKYDFSGAKYDPQNNAYIMPSGEIISGYDVATDTISNYIPSLTTVDPSTIRYGYRNQAYSGAGNTGNFNFQGTSVTSQDPWGEYLVDPKTNTYLKDANGYPIPVYRQPSGGGFNDWMTENGWILPAAMIAAGAGMAAVGGAEAGGAYGSMGGAPGMGGSMGTGLTTGAGATGGMTTGAGASGGLLGAGSASGMAATQGAAGLGGAYLTGESGLTGAEALKYANRARQAVGLANTLSKLVGGEGGKSGLDLGKLANMLAPSNTYKGLELAQITPKNPFLFTTPGQTQVSEGSYDVSGSNMANALRKKNYGNG